MTKDVKTIYRKDYQASGFIVHSLDLRFELEKNETLVESVMKIESLDTTKPLILDGEALELIDVSIDDEALDEKSYQCDESSLAIKQTPATFSLRIKTKIKPHENTTLSGLYQSGQMYCTQCEAHGFRRMTYFLDRPDVLTTYTTTIVASEKDYPVLLSNGNLIDKGKLDGGRHWVRWHDPFKKPSYLFALVAGDLACVSDEFVTRSGRAVDLKLYVEHGNEDKCEHALLSLKKAMKWDEDVYGLEYDLDIFMIVAVSSFNMGAMENKGLNIFNDKCVLARPETATDDDFANIEGIVAHEYFHNWTGNRVTCRDWFQLSLKEGLTVFRDQEFSRDMNSRDVNRIKDVDMLKRYQFPEDAGPLSHPVRPDEYIEINNFYTSTVYNKGAEVIRMQHTILGEAGFRRGMDLYFERHDGEAVTIDDFVSAMEDANGADFSQLKRWYSQAGTPEVRVKTAYKDGSLHIDFAQYCAPTPNQSEKLPFCIPVRMAVITPTGETLSLESDLFLLKEEKQSHVIGNVSEGSTLSLLQGFSAPIKLSYKQSEEELITLVRFEKDGYARFEAMQRYVRLQIAELLEQQKAVAPLTISDKFKSLFVSLIVSDEMEPALKALLLMQPSFESVTQQMKQVEVEAVCDAMDFIKHTLASDAADELCALYDNLSQEKLLQMNGEHYGKRHLKNVCLSYLASVDKASERAAAQFESAKTMTDELAAFKVLINVDSKHAEDASKSFYQKWQADHLVIDKWFAIQALKDSDSVVSELRAVMEHAAFDLKNPNKVRSLVGTFAMQNIRHFHSDAGYELLKDVVLAVDKLNPQTASRLVIPLTSWRKYADSHALKMKSQLEAMAATGSLSKDVYEMVSKSLKESS